MKKIRFFFVFFLIFISVQSQNYEKSWNKVIEHEKTGSIKSALKEVDKIYKKAKRKNNETEIVKSFFFRSKYVQHLEEDAQTLIVNNLKEEIESLNIPGKTLMKLIYVETLHAYYQANSYKINRRTSTEKTSEDDFETWTQSDFQREIDLYVQKSLTHKGRLKNMPLSGFETILEFPNRELLHSQNLYEFLLEKYIRLYESTLNRWDTKDKFYSEVKEKLMGKTSDFLSVSLDSVKNDNLKKVSLLFQEREKEFPNHPKYELKRIQFYHQSVFYDSEFMLSALTSFQNRIKDIAVIKETQYLQAKIYNETASKNDHTDYKFKALEILDSVLKVESRSNTYKLAYLLKDQILQKTVSVEALKYSYKGENTRAKINFQNTDSLILHFYKVPQYFSQSNRKFTTDSLIASVVQKQNPEHISTYRLPNQNDYFEYSTEILLPKLETGHYLVLIGTQPSDFESEKTFNHTFITISDWAIQHKSKDNRDFFQVVHRKTGSPIQDAIIEMKDKKERTDALGNAVFTKTKADKSHQNTSLIVSKESDTLQTIFFKTGYFKLNANDDDDWEDEDFPAKIEFFTDRAIYRPGQKMYVKGIVLQKKKGMTSVVPDLTVLVEISDPKDKTVKEIEVTSNAYGSFTFEFDIPKSGLTGEYSIEADEPDEFRSDDPYYDEEEDFHQFWDLADFDYSYFSFSVEEYKRPTFEVKTDSIRDDFTINDTIEVSGKVISFSGVNLSDSQVKYSVERKSYPNFRYLYFPEETKVIDTGSVSTTADGSFKIDFKALANPDLDPKKLPVFFYTVKIDVTDPSGETQTTATTVVAGYHNLKLSASLPTVIKSTEKQKLTLNSTNLNNSFKAVDGKVEVFFKSEFDTGFKPRAFGKPEIPGFTPEEFKTLFPHEKSMEVNEDKKSIFSTNVNTGETKELVLDFLKKEAAGNYEVIFSSQDSKGNQIETSSDFVLIHSENDRQDKLFTIKQINKKPFQDEFAEFRLESQIESLYITISTEDDSDFSLKQVQLTDGSAVIRIPMVDENSNSKTFLFNTYFENNLFSETFSIQKETEAELEIAVESFRNKIEPGSEQQWSFRILKENEAESAEVLASMYDSSLDQFRTAEWGSLTIKAYPSYYEYNLIDDLSNSKIYKSLAGINPPAPRFLFSNEEITLYQFGFNFTSPNRYIDPKRSEKASTVIPKNARTVSGIITDEEGLPLPGASIIVKGSTRGTQSDFDGFYSIEVAPGEEIEFSYVGFESVSKKADSDTIDLSLHASEDLEEVVVVSLGKNLRQSATKSVITNISEAETLLQGKLSGLTVESSEAPGASDQVVIRGKASLSGEQTLVVIDGVPMTTSEVLILEKDIESAQLLKREEAMKIYGSQAAHGALIITTKSGLAALQKIETRTNFNETAFFYPQLTTDSDGKISFNFTSPEALTRWKLRLLAHNKKAESGYFEAFAVTQKELMIVPNMPRFFREKDSIEIKARISNLTKEDKNGQAMLLLFDAATMNPIDEISNNSTTYKNFQTAAEGNTTISWKIYIPEGIQGVQYRVLAKSGNFSDGEENLIPVLTNSILVTESQPIWVREKSKKEFSFDRLANPKSETLRNHQLVLEYTSNPVWLAIQALPYLMEYEHDCSEQVFSRYYSNVMAEEILHKNPKIKVFFAKHNKEDLVKKLEQNEVLKSILISETPWFRDTQTEEEKNARLALLFDLNRLAEARESTLDLLKKQQAASGGFPWFEGGSENEYITTHIVAGFGKLEKRNPSQAEAYQDLIKKGLDYLDRNFLDNQANFKRTNSKQLAGISSMHYLYARSFYLESFPMADTLKKETQEVLTILKDSWLEKNLQQKAMLALVFQRFGNKEIPKKILHHLRESSSNNEDWGMYWISNKPSWHWYQAPIETQALLIEAFDEVENDKKSVEAMKVWLLKNKQVSHWSSTKSTFEAIDALLRFGADWTAAKDKTTFTWGAAKALNQKLETLKPQAETGYVKLEYNATEISEDLATLHIDNKSEVPGFGGFYWQYFEDSDKIEAQQDNPLQVSKKLFLKTKTMEGEQLQEITENNPIKTGDLVTVRLIISASENMEYIHLKDLRASGFEPIEVLSAYRYKEGLGYYQSTRDAATHFFFDRINKGTYVFEYDVRANNPGDFSNGITTIQSMYAPEFGSHTEGIRVQIKK